LRFSRSHTVELLVVFTSCLTLCACTASGEPKAATTREASRAYPGAVTAGSVVLYRVSSSRLVAFDTASKVVNAEGTRDQVFQYEFPGRQDLYTSGSSTKYGFEVLRVHEGGIRSLLQLSGRRGIFPLASDKTTDLFVLQDYGNDGKPSTQQVVQLRGSELVPVRGTDERGVTGGALIGGTLYYTVYAPQSDTYDLRRYDLTHAPSRPETIKTGLPHGPLNVFAGELVADFRLPSGQAVACDYYCFFSHDADFVVTVATNKGGDLELTALNPATGATYGNVVGDIVGFRADATGVDVYGTGIHKRLRVSA
jgi:hypothetical protein